jgi:hypothetical protein
MKNVNVKLKIEIVNDISIKRNGEKKMFGNVLKIKINIASWVLFCERRLSPELNEII